MRGIEYLAVHTSTPIMVPYVWVGTGIYFARMGVQEQWELLNTRGFATCCTSPALRMRRKKRLAAHTPTPTMVPHVWVGPGFYSAGMEVQEAEI